MALSRSQLGTEQIGGHRDMITLLDQQSQIHDMFDQADPRDLSLHSYRTALNRSSNNGISDHVSLSQEHDLTST